MTDLRLALRSVRRAPRFWITAVAVLGMGMGVSGTMLALASGGLGHPDPVVSLPGVDVPRHPRLGDLSDGPSTLERFLGASRPWQDARQSAPVLQRTNLNELLRVAAGLSVLMMAVAALNLGLLLMARGGARRPELALRKSLGATRSRLLRMLAVEGIALWLMAAVLGSMVAAAAVLWLGWSWPHALSPWLAASTIPLTVVLLVALSALLVPGLSMASAMTRRGEQLRAALGGGRQSTGDAREGDARRRLCTWGIAGSVVLLVAAGLLLRGFAIPPETRSSFHGADTLTLHLDIAAGATGSAADRARYIDALLHRISTIPGVDGSSISSAGAWIGLGTQDLAHTAPGSIKPARYHAVTPGYFASLNVPIISGRDLAPTDREDGTPVMAVNQIFVDRFFGSGNALGRQVQLGGASLDGDFYTIVGVVEDTYARALGSPVTPVPAVYLSALQVPPTIAGVAVRTRGDPMALLPEVERAIRETGPARVLGDATTLAERLDQLAAPLTWFGWIFAGAALLAMITAGMGLYGVIRYSVEQRTREFGVRLALGAPPRRVVMMVVRQGLTTAARGAVFGLLAAVCVARLLEFLFRGVDALDPMVYAGALGLITVIAMVASYAPARDASRLDPGIALRAE